MLGIGKVFAERLRLQEVVNHVAATEWALEKIRMDEHEIDLDLIREAHKILMTDVRGQERGTGGFRDRQNWIVETGKSRNKIIYTPPHLRSSQDCFANLKSFARPYTTGYRS